MDDPGGRRPTRRPTMSAMRFWRPTASAPSGKAKAGPVVAANAAEGALGLCLPGLPSRQTTESSKLTEDSGFLAHKVGPGSPGGSAKTAASWSTSDIGSPKSVFGGDRSLASDLGSSKSVFGGDLGSSKSGSSTATSIRGSREVMVPASVGGARDSASAPLSRRATPKERVSVEAGYGRTDRLTESEPMI